MPDSKLKHLYRKMVFTYLHHGLLDTVQVNSRVNGYIDQWLFRPGDYVTNGQLLYVIDQRTYRTEVQRAQAELARAEAQPASALPTMQE